MKKRILTLAMAFALAVTGIVVPMNKTTNVKAEEITFIKADFKIINNINDFDKVDAVASVDTVTTSGSDIQTYYVEVNNPEAKPSELVKAQVD